MQVEAKIAAAGQPIESAPVQQIQDQVSIEPGSSIALAVIPEFVAGFAREGADLVVTLADGATLRVANFYGDPARPSQLYLADEDEKLVRVDLIQASDGSFSSTYVPLGVESGFADLGTGGGGGGFPIGALLGGVGAAGAAAAAAGGGGGDDGGTTPPPAPPTDTTPPAAASNLAISANGATLTGTAEAGATVGIDTNRDGTIDRTVTAGADGQFQVPLDPPLTNGETVSVVVTDAAGNRGPAANVVAPDTTPPAAATDVAVAPDGSAVTGSATPGSTVRIDTNGDGTPDATGTVGTDGRFTVPLTPPLTNGETVSVVVADAAGNGSTPVTVTAPDTSAPAPATDVTVTPDGTTVTGTAEPGSTVGVDTNGDGIPDATGTAGGDGGFTIPLTPPLTNGEDVTVVVTDPSGNDSTPITVTAPDTTAPAPATGVTVSPDGTAVTGTAEPGSTVGVDTNGDGIPDATGTAGGDGGFTIPLNPPLTNGEDVTVVVTDPAGNDSTPITVTAPDTTAPDAAEDLAISPDGTVLTGTAEPGATVSVDTNGDGVPDQSTTAGPDGGFEIVLTDPLTDGETAVVVVTDGAGNESDPAPAFAPDLVPTPGAPVLAPTNGRTITGTADAGTTVQVTDASSNPVGSAVAAADGSFTITPAAPLQDGAVVTAVAVNSEGDAGPAATVTVDAAAPAAPVLSPTNGEEIAGTAEAGSTVTVTSGGAVIGTDIADANGNWSVTPAAPLADGATVTATATDPVGNVSPPASVVVDASLPSIPTVEATNGTVIEGTADAGNTVIITDGAGNAIGTAVADLAGNYSFTPAPPLADGTTVLVRAQDLSGTVSAPASTIVDAAAPAVPTIDATNGADLTGTAEAGATITLTDGAGNPIGTTTADAGGNWAFTPAAPLADSTVVNATATDAVGNVSAPASTTVDAVAPAAPVISPTNGVEIAGTAEPGSTITLTDGAGAPIGTTAADAGGNWNFTPATQLPDDSIVTATATDAVGNVSPPASVVVDASLPSIPQLEPSNGTVIEGIADAGNLVTLTDGAGNPIGQVTAGADGSFAFTPATPLPDGTVVNAVAENAAGVDSAPATLTVDAVAPAAPTLFPSDGTEVSGTAEAGALVTLTDAGTGGTIGFAIAQPDGGFTYTPSAPLADGTVVTATASDPAGNVSGPATVIVDALAPAAPTIDPTNGDLLTGTAEAGATITLTDGPGGAIGTTVADGAGNWTFTPAAPLADGTVVRATATDPTGNVSPPVTTTVDAVAPATPTIAPSNGDMLMGTAEPGSTITLSDGGGGPIGTTTSDANGDWSLDPAAPIPDGTVVTAVATDAAGNASGPATTIVDADLPSVPVLAPTNGAVVEGVADAGDTVTLTDGAGNPIGTVVAAADGSFSVTPATPLADGTVVNAVATDPFGGTSAPGTVTVDAAAPLAPTIDPTDGTILTGTAEAGALVTLTDGAGNPIGTVTAAADGSYSLTPAAPLADGTVVNTTATDAVGNVSLPATTTVDAVAPAAPVIFATNGEMVTGTAEAGALITLTTGAGTPLGTTTVDANGNWTFMPPAPLADDTVVTATASDAAGNVSGPATVTVDAALPSTPLLDPTNGTVIEGIADAGNLVTLTDAAGNPIGTVTAAPDGSFSFTPATPLPDGTVVRAVATNAVGTDSGPGTVTVDAVAPAVPTIEAGNGTVLTGTAEAGALVTLTDGAGNVIAQVTATGGTYSFTPATPLADATAVTATASDAAGNVSGPATDVVDALAPAAPVLAISGDGALLTGTAEPGSIVELVVGGDMSNPTTVQADGAGNFTVPFAPPLVDGEVVVGTATDAAGNESGPGTAFAPDLSAPILLVPEGADGYLNAAELTDGIQTIVDISPAVRAGDTVSVTFTGQNGYVATTTQVVTAADRAAGFVAVTVLPPAGQAAFPEGASSLTAQVNAGELSAPFNTTVDTIPPAAPVLSLVGNVLTVSAEPGTELDVLVSVGGVVATATVTADNSGLASLDLLTDLDLDLQLDQLLDATVSVTGTDVAGNTSNVATVDLAPTLPPPVTVGDLEVAVALFPTPIVGLRGTAENGESVRVVLTTPAANVTVTPTVDDNGNFSVNLLDPNVLLGLGLSVTGLLNLTQPITASIIATDQFGNDSDALTVGLTGSGLNLGLGAITVTGTAGNDVIYANATESETINALGGDDLVLRVAAGDNVQAGTGDDTIQIDATNFATINGGDGFDTLLLADGIDLDYNGAGVGTLANIERINLGTGDSGSTLTLLPSEVDVITDGDNILQITGDANDTLVVTGAVAAGQQTVDGVVYDVYTYGNTTLLVEDNSVQVIAA